MFSLENYSTIPNPLLMRDCGALRVCLKAALSLSMEKATSRALARLPAASFMPGPMPSSLPRWLSAAAG